MTPNRTNTQQITSYYLNDALIGQAIRKHIAACCQMTYPSLTRSLPTEKECCTDLKPDTRMLLELRWNVLLVLTPGSVNLAGSPVSSWLAEPSCGFSQPIEACRSLHRMTVKAYNSLTENTLQECIVNEVKDNDVIIKLALATAQYVITYSKCGQMLARHLSYTELKTRRAIKYQLCTCSNCHSMSRWHNLQRRWPVGVNFKEISNPVLVTAEWRPAQNPWLLKCNNPSIKPIIQLPGYSSHYS